MVTRNYVFSWSDEDLAAIDYRKMSPNRRVTTEDIVSDIRSGMTYRQLMEKYQLSLAKLHHIFRHLLDSQSLDRSELEPLIAIPHVRTDVGRRRRLFRDYVFFNLPIYDLENLLDKGTVVDISGKGLQIVGIPTRVGNTIQFLIPADYFGNIYPVVFEAQCRWVSGAAYGKLFSGFEIINISDEALGELRKLIIMLALGG